MKFVKKIFIEGKIELLTGLHIGGSSSSLDIGGIDSNVIKSSGGVPYIPGSSIKGKMRTLLELKHSKYTQRTGKVDSGQEEDIKDSNPKIQKLFGAVANIKERKTRLIVRDAYLNENILNKMINKEEEFSKLELDYTEEKWENTIDRLTASATPRNLERVPRGAIFNFTFIFNCYEETDEKELLKMLREGMELLEDDYIGGSGSRGYGQIKFKDLIVYEKDSSYYESNNKNIEKKEYKNIFDNTFLSKQ